MSSAEVVGEALGAGSSLSDRPGADGARPDSVKGDSMHVVRVGGDGAVRLIPAVQSWHWEGSSRSRVLDRPSDLPTDRPARRQLGTFRHRRWSSCKWGSNPGQPYVGVAPTSMGSFHGKVGLRSGAQRLQMKSAGPLAQLLAIPQDGGDDGDDDPLAALRKRIIRGRARPGDAGRNDCERLGRRQDRRAASGLAPAAARARPRPK